MMYAIIFIISVAMVFATVLVCKYIRIHRAAPFPWYCLDPVSPEFHLPARMGNPERRRTDGVGLVDY
jgi:hypothetical protein